eukprot:7988243-Alexandrium_andersonii.AAC.1
MRNDDCQLQGGPRDGGDQQPGFHHDGLHISALDGGTIRLVSERLAERDPKLAACTRSLGLTGSYHQKAGGLKDGLLRPAAF